MTARGALDAVQPGAASAGGERVLGLFLRALMATRKSLSLYPPGSEIASTWVRRLHRSLADFFQQGLCFPLRVEPDRFVWAGPDIRTVEPALEAFRFDLESRGIRELEIDAAVEEWELQAFLELLNMPGGELRQLGGASGFLSTRGVLRVRIGAPGRRREAEPDPSEATRQALQTGRDAVDLFVETVVGLVEARFADLTYDRTALVAWLQDTAHRGPRPPLRGDADDPRSGRAGAGPRGEDPDAGRGAAGPSRRSSSGLSSPTTSSRWPGAMSSPSTSSAR